MIRRKNGAARFAARLGVAGFGGPSTIGTILHEIASWIAPIATIIAALMTAANLGSRVTGWGFVIFTVGSLAWWAVAIATGQTNLLLTNGFLTLVNAVGIWRWLGRQARHEDGSDAAKAHSAAAKVPSLFGIGSLVGGTLIGRDGAAIGTVIDGMMRCDGAELAYIVVSEGGVGGVGERLHALHPTQLRFGDAITCDLDTAELSKLPMLTPTIGLLRSTNVPVIGCSGRASAAFGLCEPAGGRDG